MPEPDAGIMGLDPDLPETGEEEERTAEFDRVELVRGWRTFEGRIPLVIPTLRFAARTDLGRLRDTNQDKFDFYEPESLSVLAARGCLYAVADGVGGAAAGQIASELVLKTLISTYYDHPALDVEQALEAAIAEANDRIFALARMIPERSGMGTTVTAAVFVEDRVLIAQVGDSRAYVIRDGAIRQVTQDHSWVEEQVRAGAMSQNDADRSPYRNVITRSVGAAPAILIDLFAEEARVGDIWILCSDGLNGHVADAQIVRVASEQGPSEAARQLVELANAHGGADNITVVIVQIRGMNPHVPGA